MTSDGPLTGPAGKAGRDAHVRFDAVSKSYDGGAKAVDGITLDIAQGEFLTLLGPSGSGKTTTLMMLAGFEAPSSGAIWLDGKRIDRTPAHRRGIGIVFQNYALFPHMTVAGNLAFPLQVRGIGRAERDQRVKRLLQQVRLEGLESRLPAQLSGGQQQRVAVARALVFGPKLVLMDEPLGALDKQLREDLQDEIRQVHKSFGVTIVYVTHDQSEALTMSDRIALFRAGRLEQVDQPRVLYQKPATRFAARFLGETNAIDGTIIERRGESVLVDVGTGRPLIAAIGNVSGVAGEATTVCVRPEHLRLGMPPLDADNRLEARIVEAVFHGEHVRLRLDIARRAIFSAKVAAGSVEAYRDGENVSVHFQTKDCLALDSASETEARPDLTA